MGTLILISILAVVIVVIALIFVFLALNHKKAERLNLRNDEFTKRQQYASFANARVVHASGGIPSDGATQVRIALTLEVTPPGREAYRAHTDWLVDVTALAAIQPGSEIQVKIDADDSNIVYPGSEYAKYLPQ